MKNKIIVCYFVFIALCANAKESTIFNPELYSKFIANAFINNYDIISNAPLKNPVIIYLNDYDSLEKNYRLYVQDYLQEDYNDLKTDQSLAWNNLHRIAKIKGINSKNIQYANTYFAIEFKHELPTSIIYTTFKFADKTIAIRTNAIFINNQWRIIAIEDDFNKMIIDHDEINFTALGWIESLNTKPNIYANEKSYTNIFQPIQHTKSIPSLDPISEKLFNYIKLNEIDSISNISIDSLEFESHIKPNLLKWYNAELSEEKSAQLNEIIEKGIRSDKLFFSKNKLKKLNGYFEDYAIDKNKITYSYITSEISNFRNQDRFSNTITTESFLHFLYNNEEYKMRFIAKLLNDKWKIYYIQPAIFKTDEHLTIATAVDLPKNEEVKEYDDLGLLKYKWNYKNDLKNGKSFEYFASGNIKYIRNYINDNLENETKEYDNNANLVATWIYKNNLLNGISYEYFSNGNIRYIRNYVNNKLEGEMKEYDKDKNLIAIWNYKDDLLNGISYEYFLNGKIRSSRNFVDDNLKGWQINYMDDGTIFNKKFIE